MLSQGATVMIPAAVLAKASHQNKARQNVAVDVKHDPLRQSMMP